MLLNIIIQGDFKAIVETPFDTSQIIWRSR